MKTNENAPKATKKYSATFGRTNNRIDEVLIKLTDLFVQFTKFGKASITNNWKDVIMTQRNTFNHQWERPFSINNIVVLTYDIISFINEWRKWLKWWQYPWSNCEQTFIKLLCLYSIGWKLDWLDMTVFKKFNRVRPSNDSSSNSCDNMLFSSVINTKHLLNYDSLKYSSLMNSI